MNYQSRFLVLLLFFVFPGLFAIIMAGPVQAEEFPPDIQRIKDSGKLRVSILNRDIYPFIYEDDNKQLDGIDIRMAKKMASTLGVEVDFVRVGNSFNAVVQQVIDRQADVAISKISATLTRAEKVLFSRPYLVLNQALLLNRVELAKRARGRSETDFIKSLNATVGVIKNSSYQEYVATIFPKAEPVYFNNWSEAVEAVFTGDVLAVYRDDFEVKRAIHERSDGALLAKSVVMVDLQDEISIVVGWQDSHLLAWVNRFLSRNVPTPFGANQVLKDHEQLLR